MWHQDRRRRELWHSWFRGWRSPAAFQQALWIISNQAGDHLLDTPGLQWFRDAWLAARYGQALSADLVRLSADDPPDFEVRFPSGILQRCEGTEVLKPGRRRNDELKAQRRSGKSVVASPDEDWLEASDVLKAVDEAIERKAAKAYPEKFVLVVYVNVGFVVGRRELARSLDQRQQSGHPAFSALRFVHTGVGS